MRRHVTRTAWILALLWGVPHLAHATNMAPGGLTGLLRTPTADTAGRGVFEFGVLSSFHTLQDADLNRHYFWIQDLQLNVGPSPHLEIGVALPLRTRWLDRSDGSVGPTHVTGFGDLVAGAKLQLPVPGRYFRLGAYGSLSAPTGSSLRGFSSGDTDFELGGMATIDLSSIESFVPLRLHFSGGYRWNQNELEGLATNSLDDVNAGGFWPPAYPAVPFGESNTWNDHVPVRGAIEFNTNVLDLFTEFSADLLPKIDRLTFTDHFVFVTQGAVVKFRNGIHVKLAADVSLQRDDRDPIVLDSPDWRLTLGVTWKSSLTFGDSDQDGVSNEKDACPEEAEDYDGYQDDDGCPELDNDGDGIPDRDDLAPDLPEDVDGFEDDDGRPDMDNDGDGISDERDGCPNEPEDFDGDRDLDGCPDNEARSEPARPEDRPAAPPTDDKPSDKPQDDKPADAPQDDKPKGDKPERKPDPGGAKRAR